MYAFPEAPLEMNAAQKERLRRFNVTACADVHCHCLPGFDDGPETLEEALALCRALADDGITLVVATPHQMGRYDGQNASQRVREGVIALQAALVAEKIFLGVVPGGDVRIDERLGDMVDRDRVCSIGDGRRYLLLELPNDSFIDPDAIIPELTRRGITPIITHPERHPHLSNRPEMGIPWIERGAAFQVTAGSIAGAFGKLIERSAWAWIEQGLAQIVATDAHHAQRRPPLLSAAIDRITERLSHITARRLCLENPLRVVRGEALASARPRVRTLRSGKGGFR